ncbi:SRPBCC family protein [Myxococcota bacterium]|nr:SRPBCC family protein [Myxococcota bacterium]
MAGAKVSQVIQASAETVWDLLGDFGGVMRFSAGIESCTVEGEGLGAVRTLRVPGGIELDERREALDESARTLSYSIIRGPLPMQDYYATISVHEEGENVCRVDWESTYEPNAVTEEQAQEIAEGIYNGSLAAVKKTLGV